MYIAHSSSSARAEEEEDEEFAVFDGFQDGKAVLGGSTGGGGRGGGGANLSWDAERGLWKESKPRSAFGSRLIKRAIPSIGSIPS